MSRRRLEPTLQNGQSMRGSSPVVLVGASAALVVSLVALVLFWPQTPEVSRAGLQSGKFFDGPLGTYLLLFALGVAVVACAVLAAVAVLLLRNRGSRARGSAAASARRAHMSATRDPEPAPADGSAANFSADGEIPAETDLPGEPLENRPWIKLVEECVELVDELDQHSRSFDGPRRELTEHVILRLEEVLERSGVEVISGEETFDRGRHKPDGVGTAAPGAAISGTLSPGFAVGRRVLRRARVQVE